MFVGSSFTLAVNITSYNVKPTVEWALNGAAISEGEGYIVETDIEELGSGASRLTVMNAGLVSNVERFTVNVSNHHAGGRFCEVEFEVRIVGTCVVACSLICNVLMQKVSKCSVCIVD